MQRLIVSFLCVLVALTGWSKSVEKLFKQAMAEGRNVGEYYKITTDKKDMFDSSEFEDYCKKHDYVFDNKKTTLRLQKRFGDERHVVEHFYFLPNSEVYDCLFEVVTEKTVPISSLQSIGNAYLFIGQKNEFKLYQGIKWQGALSPEGMLDGYGYGMYHSGNSTDESYIIKGQFVNGVPQGKFSIKTIINADVVNSYEATIDEMSGGWASYVQEIGDYKSSKIGFLGIPSSVIPAQYDKLIEPFSNGRACVQKGNEEFYINTSGTSLGYSDRYQKMLADKEVEKKKKEAEEEARQEAELNRIANIIIGKIGSKTYYSLKTGDITRGMKWSSIKKYIEWRREHSDILTGYTSMYYIKSEKYHDGYTYIYLDAGYPFLYSKTSYVCEKSYKICIDKDVVVSVSYRK